MSEERKRTLEAYGAELVLTDPERRMLAAIEEAEQIRDETGAWMPNQFANPANPRIHYETTGPELWAQLDGRIDAFVYGSGTGGTISGVGRFLKERRPGRRSSWRSSRRDRRCSRAASAASTSSRAWARASFPTNFDRSRRRPGDPGVGGGRVSARAAARARGGAVRRHVERRDRLGGARRWRASSGPGSASRLIAPDSGARYLSTALFSPEDTPDPTHVVL